jgi:zinc transport system substrate-binding protein
MRGLYASLAALAIGQAAWAETPAVVTDFGPVHSLVTMVMGDLGKAEVLLPLGGDAHDFQLRPSQAQNLAAADLVVWVGPEMTPWLERALSGLSAGTSLPLLDAQETYTRPFATVTEHEDHAETHDHDSHKDEHEGHAHDGIDPHAWLDPENARIWLGLIAEALAQEDPEHAATYRANAAAAQTAVTGIEADVVAILAPVKDKPFAVMHQAYGYFSDHFGLQLVGSLRMGDAAPPGAAHIAELQETLKETQAICIFPEANHSDASIAQMAEAVGLRLGAPLDPEGSTLAPGAALYGDLMLQLAKDLSDCLSDQ